MTKMLNPNRESRFTIDEVLKHQWITSLFIEVFPQIDNRWRMEVYNKLADQFNITVKEVCDQLASNPYGQLGGIYNIEKRFHRLGKITLKRAPQVCAIHEAKVINQINSIYPSQISTSLTHFISLTEQVSIEQRISN
jgi:hypothetical protein